MEWILGHMEDVDFNDPLPAPTAAAAVAAGGRGGGANDAAEEDREKISMLEGMGFSEQQAKAALKVRR